MEKLSAAIWDMDGTLLDTERLALECAEQICTDAGCPDARTVLLQVIGRTARDADGIIRKHFASYIDAQELRERKRALMHERMEREGMPVKPGVRQALAWLLEHGIPSAVASSTQQSIVHAHLERAGLGTFFRETVGGDQVQRGKPDPEIFLTAAEKLGVQPTRCLAIEDSHNGVIAAHAAGMHVIMVPDMIPPNPEIHARIHHMFSSLEEAMPLLATLFAQ